MKTTVQIKTGEFEYIMQELDGTPDEAVEAYQALRSAYQGVTATDKLLDAKKWNPLLDKYLNGGSMSSEDYYAMSPTQQFCIQEIKKSLQRLQAHEDIKFTPDDGGPGKGESGDYSSMD